MGEYYSESYWAAREERMKFAQNSCEICTSREDLEAHHRGLQAYIKDLAGTMEMQDLIILCKACHQAVTDSLRERRYRSMTDPEIQMIQPVFGEKLTNHNAEDPPILTIRKEVTEQIKYVKRLDPPMSTF